MHGSGSTTTMRGDVGEMVGLPSWVRATPTEIFSAGVPTTVGADESSLGVFFVVGPLLGASVKVIVSVGAWDSTTSVSVAVGVEVAGSSSTTRMLGVALASELVGVNESELVGESVACSVTVSVATSVGLAVV
jgi:hypothetical protein